MVLKLVVGIGLIAFGIYHIKSNKRSSEIWLRGRKRVYNLIGFKHVAEFQNNPVNKAMSRGGTYIISIISLIIGIGLTIAGLIETLEYLYF